LQLILAIYKEENSMLVVVDWPGKLGSENKAAAGLRTLVQK
jgi:hypothetical protein